MGPVGKTWGILAVAALALTSCGTASEATPADSQTRPASASASPTPSARAKIAESVCKDAGGDSSSQAADLDQVRLLSDGKLMFVEFTTLDEVAVTGTVLYSVTAWSPDGKTGYQIGAQFQNGREVSNFVYNLTTSKQENITNGAVAADKEVSTRYPLAKLSGLGDTFAWSGTFTVDGKDVDRCPNGDPQATFPNV